MFSRDAELREVYADGFNRTAPWAQQMKAILFLVLTLVVLGALAQYPSKEDQVATCQAILGSNPAAAECERVFRKSADCCIQYDESRLAKACATMSGKEAALACFTKIHEVGFWNTDLLPENSPGLGASFAEQWKKTVLRVCSAEPTNKAAIDCAILQKSGIKFVFNQRNNELRRQPAGDDSILKFCREAFGDYWEGVDECVQRQTAAKRRLGK